MLSYREPRGRTVWVQSYSTLLVPKDRLWKGNTKYLESVLLPHSEVASIPAVGLSHKVDSNESVSATSFWLVAASLTKKAPCLGVNLAVLRFPCCGSVAFPQPHPCCLSQLRSRLSWALVGVDHFTVQNRLECSHESPSVPGLDGVMVRGVCFSVGV